MKSTAAERTLTQAEIERLKKRGIQYPWSPWDVLALLDRIEDTKRKVVCAVMDLENYK
jgi:hypothetical protein